MPFEKYIKIFLTICLIGVSSYASQAQSDKPNILFIYVDDMNDYAQGFNGHSQAETPAIQMLVDNGTLFLNAHASSPKCMPSRTSTITGKNPFYTDVYRNKACKPLHEIVDGELFVLPEFMKDSADYFTYGTGKILHCFDSYPEYDNITSDNCAKNLSWNKYVMFPNGENPVVAELGGKNNLGLKGMKWAMIPDSLEKIMWDYQATDSLISFIQQVGNGEDVACGKPLFMMLGLHKPHQTLYIPEKYFSKNFLIDFYKQPFDRPYNFPAGTYPNNGVIMPPQPQVIYQDFYDLPTDSLAQKLASTKNIYLDFIDEVNALNPLPEIIGLNEIEIRETLNETLRANLVIAYMAAIKFIDAQIIRLLETLQLYPEIYNNTIIVFISDHGYSLGEKRHWQKGTLWETDLRVPMIIADMRNPKSQTVNSMVSLLDVFPTLCDFAGADYPVFIDGSRYLDGHSLMPLMEHPEKHIEEIAIAAYEQQPENEFGQQDCFPQYSARSDRFHYIQYNSNNAGWETECNAELSWQEEEFYEIGINKDVDPNEWNNLISNTDYTPVIAYLKQFLPGEKLYTQNTFKANIKTGTLECIESKDAQIPLAVDVFDTLGNAIESLSDYKYQWTNNFNNDTLFGNEILFDMHTVSNSIFENNQRVIFYFQLMDTLNNITAALDLKYIYINPENIPAISFSLNPNNIFEAEISDISIEGTYNSMSWDYGDGTTFYTANPGPYNYALNGDYTVTLNVQYGNEAGCEISYSQLFSTHVVESADNFDFIIYPNPTNTTLYIYQTFNSSNAVVQIYSINGELISEESLYGVDGNYAMDVSYLRPGMYYLNINNGNSINAKAFVVLY